MKLTPDAVDCPECQHELRTGETVELHSCDPKNQPRHQQWLDRLTEEADLVPDETGELLDQLSGTEEVEPE